MSHRSEGETTWRRAGSSWVEDAVRWALVHDPRPTRTARDAAFRAYLRRVRAVMRADPAPFVVEGARELAAGSASRIVEVELSGPEVTPGDVLLLRWSNPATGESDPDPVRYWTTPLPHRPARRATTTRAALREHIRAADGGRITPRFYTCAGAGAGRVRIQVTRVADWPERSAAFWHRVQPGTQLTGWVLPHPHRLDRTGPGCALVTGSGAAGVFAGLRHGARDVRLIWGIGDKRLAPWVVEELDEHLRTGALAELMIVSSPRRITDVLAERLGAEVDALGAGQWIYVSGHEQMGESVDALLAGAAGKQLQIAHDALRYIVST